MTARVLVFTTCLMAAAGSTLAQQPGASTPQTPRAATPAPPAPPASTALRIEGQPVNVKVEVTITDQRPGIAPVKKTVSVVAGDGMSGFIRTTATYVLSGIATEVPLNIDAEPRLLADGKIRLRLNLQYDLPTLDAPADTPRPPRKTQIHENLGLILESSKPLVAAQSADPVSDRQVTVEVKATILR